MFGTEAELCEPLVKLARDSGYEVHAEVSNWDLLIVCRQTGMQCGVQAKLRPSVDVLAQALGHEKSPGPDLHAVLVPFSSPAFAAVADHLRVHVFRGVYLEHVSLPRIFESAFRWTHKRREWIPEVEVITPAGVPSPRSITRWKLAAVKLCMLARERGYVTPADMRELKLSRHWWFSAQFGPMLVSGGERGKYVLRDPLNENVPDLRWPEITRALCEKKTPVRKGPRLRCRRIRSEHIPEKIQGEVAV